MTSRTRLIVLLVSTPVLAFVLIGGFLGKAAAGDETYRHLRVFEDVVSLIINNYVEEVEMDKVMQGGMRGLADGLDADSSYLLPSEVRLVEKGEALPEGDVGLELTRQYYLRVIAARDGSPASRAGLRPGDYVRAIDGKPTRDLSVFEGVRMLHGPAGTKVSLTVIRGNAAEPHTLDLTREKPAMPPVTTRLAAPNVGYLRIPAFGTSTPDEVKTKIAALTQQGASRLILDLRGTAEGPADLGPTTARLFVPSGTLIIREARSEPRRPVAAQTGDGTITLPIDVLINSGTSGAAELFVASLEGNKRAETIGERTLGRAGEQKLVKLPDGSGLWMTYARYLTPAGEPIHGKGLEPNVEVEEPDQDFGAPVPVSDPVLEKALERAGVKAAA